MHRVGRPQAILSRAVNQTLRLSANAAVIYSPRASLGPQYFSIGGWPAGSFIGVGGRQGRTFYCSIPIAGLLMNTGRGWIDFMRSLFGVHCVFSGLGAVLIVRRRKLRSILRLESKLRFSKSTLKKVKKKKCIKNQEEEMSFKKSLFKKKNYTQCLIIQKKLFNNRRYFNFYNFFR